MADYGVNTGKFAFVALLASILTVVTIVGLQVVYYRYELGRETSERLNPPPVKLEALLRVQQVRLTDYRVIDPEKAIVAVPIERAMELVVSELSKPQGVTPPQGDVQAEEDPDER